MESVQEMMVRILQDNPKNPDNRNPHRFCKVYDQWIPWSQKEKIQHAINLLVKITAMNVKDVFEATKETLKPSIETLPPGSVIEVDQLDKEYVDAKIAQLKEVPSGTEGNI